jgi:hypothetical protein
LSSCSYNKTSTVPILAKIVIFVFVLTDCFVSALIKKQEARKGKHKLWTTFDDSIIGKKTFFEAKDEKAAATATNTFFSWERLHYERRCDTRHDDVRHNDTQQNDKP